MSNLNVLKSCHSSLDAEDRFQLHQIVCSLVVSGTQDRKISSDALVQGSILPFALSFSFFVPTRSTDLLSETTTIIAPFPATGLHSGS